LDRPKLKFQFRANWSFKLGQIATWGTTLPMFIIALGHKQKKRGKPWRCTVIIMISAVNKKTVIQPNE